MVVMAYHQASNFIVSKTQLVIFSFKVTFFGTVVVEHICIDIFNLFKHYRHENVYYQWENWQLRFGNYEVWSLMINHGNHKTCTVLPHLVVRIHIQSFKWFHSVILKIHAIFQYVNLLCTYCDVMGVLFEYLISREREEIWKKFSVT